jgi:cytochrome b561
MLNFTLLALVCIHVAAALGHRFADRDAVLTRMLSRPWSLRDWPRFS